jgi:type III pantothenate kinase
MDTLGADRFCAVLAARELYGAPVVVVDCGTATTVNVVDGEGVFLGGSIAPGVQTALRALHEHTAQLPALSAEDVAVIGSDSASSMRSGAVHFSRFAVEGMIREVHRVTGAGTPVLLTGGNAPVLLGAGLVLPGMRHDPNLLFRGVIFYLHFTR